MRSAREIWQNKKRLRRMTPLPSFWKRSSVLLGSAAPDSYNYAAKMCLKQSKLECNCEVGACHLKMREVNKAALFRYPWTQHLVCIIHFTFRCCLTRYVDIHILNLTGYSTQMCCTLNIPPIFSVVVLTEADTKNHQRGTSAHHHDLIPALKRNSHMSKEG